MTMYTRNVPLLLVLLVCLARLWPVEGLSTIATEEMLDHELQTFTSGCYFSAEYQGEFVMQVSSGNSIGNNRGSGNNFDDGEPIVQYSTLNITFNAIPVWGYCHKKINDKVLLMDRRGGYGECIRCFQLTRRSRNIIEVYSKDLNSCYTNETVAIESCKQLNTTAILYRTSEVGGEKIRNEYCPIAGRYHFKYNVNYEYESTENNNAPLTKDECNSFSSDLDNCLENGSILHLQFKQCSFDDLDIQFECLGTWPASDFEAGSNSPRYVALLDSRGLTDFSGPARRRRPRYRCGLYHVDSKTAKTYLTLSSDSSCTQNLYNSTSGYESLVLSKTTTQKKMPSYVISNLATFPHWAQGEWEETLIVNGTMTFNDLNGYKSFTFVTVDSNDETGRYIVFSRDQCEQEAYVCLIMKQRSENVLEFTTGVVSSPVYQRFLCNDTNLLLNRSSAVWWTLARLERTVESPCPITGQYTGQITDLPGTCAELSSNCNNRQVMYYQVYDCNSGELYEERTYLCLGQWEEKGVTYTYTMRNDTGTNECFVGTIVSDEEIYIKEAGDYCIRNIDPKTEGMRLYKQGQCYGNSSSPAPTIATKTSPHVPIMKITTPIRTVTTKMPITTRSRSVTKKSTTEKIPTSVRSSSVTLHQNRASCLSFVIINSIICIFYLISSRSMRFHA